MQRLVDGTEQKHKIHNVILLWGVSYKMVITHAHVANKFSIFNLFELKMKEVLSD